ncbi:hypothetical protein [Arenimonas sp.]|uniref:hypothetical protein n=1 Tax=Arenimonas sp. TaxID=1872635 RepID=UPI0039E2A864
MKYLLACSFLLLPGFACADTRIAYTVEGSCPALAERIEISGSLLRLDSRYDGQLVTSLFDGGEDTVTSLMHDQKQFHQMEVDADAADYTADVLGSTMTYVDRQMEATMAQMKKSCEQMKAQTRGRGVVTACDNMPDLRSMMSQATGATPQLKPEMRETNREDSVAGATCRWTEAWQGEMKLREQCDADVASLPLPDGDRGGFARGMRVMMSYGDAFKPVVDRFAMGDPNPIPIPGKGKFTLAGQCFDATGERVGHYAADIVVGPIDPQRFQVPTDYTPMMQADPQ